MSIKEIPMITLKEAQKIVLKNFNKRSPTYTLDTKGEELLANYIKAKYDSDFVFITKYPAKKRPMYTMPDLQDPDLTNSFDLIYKGLEITTGGQRIHDYQMLIENMKKFDIDPEAFDFYTDSFKYGMPPHGGFAIGLERLTMKILNLDNIREASLLPRDMNRLTP
jgi:nondiscriminating aspartyl-tRNA synthetase